ncbi:DUF1254 domain-containing protein [uncultured Pseudacidovorax sp.]|uniref:DUF1254 domain-containing protein n=1 Tax=uncultured Pseudacidovorax sp. TaxID=679313 RepID=UPI0025D53180|nr:DUF1254 domain-containing protein [uncultured Pseudacidovorax sp.]
MNDHSAAVSDADRDVVVHAYPLYEMRRMRAATSPRRLADHGEAPAGQRWCNVFAHTRELLAPGRSRVVTPNNDTLYSTAWLHVDEPLVIDVPDTQGRYYVLGLLDFFTNPFAHLGTRCTGNAARAFVLTPPGWQGDLPAQLQAPGCQVPCPTPWVWIIGRILVDGEHDLAGAHAVQDGLKVRRLSDWMAGRPPRPACFDPDCDPTAPPTASHFAHQVRAALAQNPTPPDTGGVPSSALAAVGLDPASPAPEGRTLDRLTRALREALDMLRATETGERTAEGWILPPQVQGSFGSDHRTRALVALKYIGMLESAEAYYPMAWQDEDGQPLTGRRVYALRFAPGATPPVDAFWSITLYDARDYMLVANPIGRYAIGDRTEGLAWAADGSLTIHIAHQAPDDPHARANWLPAPAGDFYLCLRAYIPRPALLEGRWRPPALRVIGEAEETADLPTAMEPLA